MSKKRLFAVLIPVLLAAGGLITFTILQGGGSSSPAVTPPAPTQAGAETALPLATPAGDAAAAGQAIFAQRCRSCHGPEGTGGRAKTLNPASAAMRGSDATAFSTNLTEIITHGKGRMPAWGDSGRLTPEQIADVVAYILSLNE